jgi:hypothetical protein
MRSRGWLQYSGQELPSQRQSLLYTVFPVDDQGADAPRIDDLDALWEELRMAGMQVDPHREDYDYGRFAWIMDPDGKRIEL